MHKLLNFIWACLYLPIGLPLSCLFPWAQNRAKFERKNFTDPLSSPQASALAFEISSEGELEQIYPLLEYFLNQGVRVELIYSSDSVEDKCQKLGKSYPQNLRIFRLPLITHFFANIWGGQSLKSWVSSPYIIFCRYDFYPNLLSLDIKRGLVSASLKGKKYRRVYNLFDFIVCASPKEELQFRKYFAKPLMSLDFRVLRIGERVQNADLPLDHHKAYLENFDINKRVLLGSCWPNEMAILKNKNLIEDILDKKVHLALAPHSLNNESIENLKKHINLQIPIYELDDSVDASKLFLQMAERPGLLIIRLKGILCELYTLYGQAFVGGGHGRSIHSVLEPYLAYCEVYCGPKTHRSLEFDLIKEISPKHIHVVRKLEQFYDNIQTKPIEEKEREIRDKVLADSKVNFERIISLISGYIDG